jgi:MinD-like ATPase involved in chromosome partitioning or flagellar assembly
MVTFDDVLPALLRVCEEFQGFDSVERSCVVRDLQGRVRLAVSTGRSAALDAQALEKALQDVLGAWFEGPVLVRGAAATADRRQRELARLTASVLDAATEEWTTASWEDPATGSSKQPAAHKWFKIERRLSKAEWTGRRPSGPPWPLVRGKPAIATFFSFKGGVGRTTLLAAVAWQLAAAGKRVVAIDLDVEAPGLGSLLGAETRRGVTDFLVDFIATGTVNITDLRAPATELGAEAPLVDVIPAGTLDDQYFEKLGRLDFAGSGLLDEPGGSPVHGGLDALLKAISALDPAPAFILLDSRAGLHDMAGLSLHALAHVEVVVARDSQQGYLGLDLTVEALARQQRNELQCVVVQSMAPIDPGTEEYRRVTSEFRAQSWRIFSEHIHGMDGASPPTDATADAELAALEDDSAASEDSDNSAHYPWVIRYNDRLIRFSSLAAIRAELFAEEFRRVVERIQALSVPAGRPT